MKILGIETSCDETGVAIVEASGGFKNPRLRIIKNLVASQTKIHEKFGGVVPNLAKREHAKNLPVLLRKIFEISKIDVIAVTNGPGLEPALWTGINFAKKLAREWKKPIVAVNHLEGHVYAPLLSQSREFSKIKFPAIILLISGGHTELVLMTDYLKYKLLGSTRDDAAGESFDKVARMLGLPYPGGPQIELFARKGNSSAFDFPRPMLNQKNLDFSFSGLKTAVLYTLRDHPRAKRVDIAASFQQAVMDVLVTKTVRAINIYKPKTIILGGGVVANTALRNAFKKEMRKIKPAPQLLLPKKQLALDNGAMIAAAGYFYALKKQFTKPEKLKANANRNFNT